VVWVGALAAPAAGQNLDAGKPPAQIFSEVCANCHRSARDFRSGASSSFLREHYMTSSDMASTMATYLSSLRSDPRATNRPEPARDARRGQQAGDAKPGDPKSADAKSSDAKSGDAKSLAPSPGPSRARPASARVDAVKPATTAETKPPGASTAPVAATAPAPPLEELEE